MSDSVTMTKTEDGLSVLRNDKSYKLMMKFSAQNAPMKQIGVALLDSAKQTVAMYGVHIDQGALVSGEFILGMAAPEGFVGLPKGLVIVQATMPNLGRPTYLALRPDELEGMKAALRALPGHQDGMFGPRGSVMVFGAWSYRGTWPVRLLCLEVHDWIALGNKNKFSEIAKETYHSAKFGLEMSYKIAKLTGQVR